MPRGGARPGAGRKPSAEKKLAKGFTVGGKKTPDAPENWPFGTQEPAKPPPAPAADGPTDADDPVIPGGEPLDFLQAVINDTSLKLAVRMQAAAIAAPFKHAKPLPKKDEPKAPAKGGKFGVRQGPRLVASNK